MEPRKEAIIEALRRWIKQRPGLEYANYGDPTSYRAECRSIARDGREAATLLAAVSWRDSITADALIRAAQGAYSGRLTITTDDDAQLQRHVTKGDHYSAKLDYCTGQYWPTEYRKAACAVLASALWDHMRENMPPITGYRVESWSQLGKGREYGRVRTTRADADAELAGKGGQDYGHVNEVYGGNVSAGDWLRAHFAREFGRGIASRWFR